MSLELNPSNVVWLIVEQRYGILISRGAYMSRIAYYDDDDTLVEDNFENDGYETWRAHAIGNNESD